MSGMDDHLHSWSPESLPYWGQGKQTAKVPPECQGSQWPMQSMRGWCGFPGNGSDLMDGSVADHAVKVLQELHANRTTRNDSRPFFMGVGFHKPHMPHWCPQSFFDQYPLEDIQLASNPWAPRNAPQIAAQVSKDLRMWVNASGSHGGDCLSSLEAWNSTACQLSDIQARTVRRGYYACTSWTDSLIGQVIDEVSRLGLESSTSVVLWGDQ